MSVRVAVGTDIVQISRIAGSLAAFGPRFVRRVFTTDEAAYATTADRLATRFAAKEAARKLLVADRGDDERGIGWRELEVRRADNGACALVLHGAARAAADALGIDALALSMSRDGDYATATVVATCNEKVIT